MEREGGRGEREGERNGCEEDGRKRERRMRERGQLSCTDVSEVK